MAGVTSNRNSPFRLFSVDSVTEIHRPPYMGGESSVIFSGRGFAVNAELFGLEQATRRTNDRPEAAGAPVRGIAGPERCNAESMGECVAALSADRAPLWRADTLAGLLPWDKAEIELFAKRQARIVWLGYGGASERLAEQLVNRDRDQDDRRLCVECGHCRAGYGCGTNAGFMLEQLQRCGQFADGPHQNEGETP